jgi:hypothetical protein
MPSRRMGRTDIAISGFAPPHPSSGKLRGVVKIHSLMKAAPFLSESQEMLAPTAPCCSRGGHGTVLQSDIVASALRHHRFATLVQSNLGKPSAARKTPKIKGNTTTTVVVDRALPRGRRREVRVHIPGR